MNASWRLELCMRGTFGRLFTTMHVSSTVSKTTSFQRLCCVSFLSRLWMAPRMSLTEVVSVG